MSDFFSELQQIKELSSRTSEAMGGVYSDPFNEIATIVSVSDPLQLGRVKVQFQDGDVSDWTPVLGSNTGILSAQYIGASCLITKAHGNSGDAFVAGFFNLDPNVTVSGAPVQLTLLDEQVEAYRPAQTTGGDQGLKCNKGNAGKAYIIQNEIDQDVVVCMRRNNPQEGGEDIWNWKSLTHSKWVEKGFDPGVSNPTVVNYKGKTGLPECSKAFEGEIHAFAEDRKFRSFEIKCDRDENGNYNWKPLNSTPVFFRTLLPPCTENLHGMNAIVDDGINSQRVSCQRYQGQMRWVNSGKREPIQFYDADPPMTKEEFINSAKAISAFSDTASAVGFALSSQETQLVLTTAASAVPSVATDPQLHAAMVRGNALPPKFDAQKLLGDIVKIVAASRSSISISSLTDQLITAINRQEGEDLDPTLVQILSVAGDAGEAIRRGLENGELEASFSDLGKQYLNTAIRSLPPQVRSVYTGYMSRGALGAIDAAALVGISQLPEEVAQYVSPIWDLASDIIRSKPSSISDVFESALGLSGKSLPQTIDKISSLAGTFGDLVGVGSNITSMLKSGVLGDVAGAITNFTNLSGLPKLNGLSSVPQLASTALELVGAGKQFVDLLGQGGIGLNSFQALSGINPISTMLAGVPALSSVFSGLGGGADCPCDPKCRKISHSEDSDGNILLKECGNVVANSASSYAPEGDITQNNENVVAKALDLLPTAIGEDLCIPNTFDLTQMLTTVKRLSEMADRVESAKNADWPELWQELVYTFEAIEKGFKQTDNNITKVESIERKLIDAQYRLITKLMVGNSSFFSQTLLSIIETSKAIKDTYNYVKRLDFVKNGARVGVIPTGSLLNVFKNITAIAKLNTASKLEANFINRSYLQTASNEWRQLEPAKGLVNLADFVIGLVPKDLPATFGKCRTTTDKNKVLKNSLESKINTTTGGGGKNTSSLVGLKLPSNIRDQAGTGGLAGAGGLSNVANANTSGVEGQKRRNFSSLLDQIEYQNQRAVDKTSEC